MMVLAQNLYFCSIANNHGALTLIADSAEEEDVKEDMLLYAFLARRRPIATHCPRSGTTYRASSRSAVGRASV